MFVLNRLTSQVDQKKFLPCLCAPGSCDPGAFFLFFFRNNLSYKKLTIFILKTDMKHFFNDIWIHFKFICQDIWQALLPALMMIGAFLQPIQMILLTVGFAIIADTIFARIRVYVQKKRNAKKIAEKKRVTKLEQEKATWTSRSMQMGIIGKVFMYTSAVLLVFFLDYAILNEFVKLFVNIDFLATKVLAGVFVYVEALSMDESFKIIKGKSMLTYMFELINKAKKIKVRLESVNKGKKKEDEPEQPE